MVKYGCNLRSKLLLDTYFKCFDEEMRKRLLEKKELHVNNLLFMNAFFKAEKQPTFRYASFLKTLDITSISQAIDSWIQYLPNTNNNDGDLLTFFESNYRRITRISIQCSSTKYDIQAASLIKALKHLHAISLHSSKLPLPNILSTIKNNIKNFKDLYLSLSPELSPDFFSNAQNLERLTIWYQTSLWEAAMQIDTCPPNFSSLQSLTYIEESLNKQNLTTLLQHTNQQLTYLRLEFKQCLHGWEVHNGMSWMKSQNMAPILNILL